jgi:hypothetical protein
MGKENSKKEEKPKKNNLKAFLKKRAPLYLAGITLIIISAHGILTEKGLDDFLVNISEEEQIVVDILMQYNGPNESGFNVKNGIEDKIKDEYPDEKIFDNRNTRVELDVTEINLEEYQVILNFKGYKGEIIFDWNVNIDSKKIESNNSISKNIINLVDFYD